MDILRYENFLGNYGFEMTQVQVLSNSGAERVTSRSAEACYKIHS